MTTKKKSSFPEPENADLKYEEIQAWKLEANKANYDKKFERMASALFFFGGKVPQKSNVINEDYLRGKAYLRKWLSSWTPKHEDKELVAGYILSRISAC